MQNEGFRRSVDCIYLLVLARVVHEGFPSLIIPNGSVWGNLGVEYIGKEPSGITWVISSLCPLWYLPPAFWAEALLLLGTRGTEASGLEPGVSAAKGLGFRAWGLGFSV